MAVKSTVQTSLSHLYHAPKEVISAAESQAFRDLHMWVLAFRKPKPASEPPIHVLTSAVLLISHGTNEDTGNNGIVD
eukprot:Skav223357  [mRNA]  locus=scaffold200:502268:502498:- [translate_table: standard]